MKVLVGFEYSGAVRDAFIREGHDAISCDILPTSAPGPHHQGDIRDLLDEPFDIAVMHPPCTILANSGVRWLWAYDKVARKTIRDEDGEMVPVAERWEELREAAELFRLASTVNAPRIAIENPGQHRHAVALHGLGRQTQTIEPWMFGHPERKATGLWLTNLPQLAPTDDVEWLLELLPKRETQRIHHMSPGPDRGHLRSLTYPGIATAMAQQWGALAP